MNSLHSNHSLFVIGLSMLVIIMALPSDERGFVSGIIVADESSACDGHTIQAK